MFAVLESAYIPNGQILPVAVVFFFNKKNRRAPAGRSGFFTGFLLKNNSFTSRVLAVCFEERLEVFVAVLVCVPLVGLLF